MKIPRVLLLTLVLVLAAAGVMLFAAWNVVSPPLTAFYTPPNPLPFGEPGEIIKTEKIETKNANVQAWRVMYHSRDLKGNDVAITGLFAAPTVRNARRSVPSPAAGVPSPAAGVPSPAAGVPSPAAGVPSPAAGVPSPADVPSPDGVPLIALAHGTEGLARQCATSLDAWSLPAFAQEFFSFPDTVIVPFVEAGYAVAATDFQGLGAPGDSAFLIGSLEAQNVLDSIRAIRAFEQVKLNDKNFVWGHSQGGHAAAFTAQLASELAPEIKLHGIVIGAPAAQLEELVNAILVPDKPSPITGVAMMVAGSWRQTYQLPLDVVFTPKGINDLPRVYQECILGASAAFNFEKPSAYYYSNPTTTSPWRDTMLLNTPKPVLYPAPVFVAQGESDPVIAPQTTRAFANQLCAAGNAVQFKLYPNTDHLGAISASRADVIAWLNARSRNETAPSNCDAPFMGKTFDRVIFSDDAFTPDESTIMLLEARVPSFLAQQQNKFSAHKPPILERFDAYKFQYWGEMENGKRVIVVNAFCANFDNWKTQRVFVLDGGDCFFNVKYDMETGTFFDLSVNGEG